MRVRAFLWSAHRWIGLACALPFLILAATGLAMLACHATGFGDTQRLDRSIADTSGIDRALAAVRSTAPGGTPSLILPGIDHDHAWAVQLRGPGDRQRVAEIDPAHGRLLRIRQAGSGVPEALLSIHSNLTLGAVGRLVILMTAIGVLLLSLSGFGMIRRPWRTLRAGPFVGTSRLRSLHHWAGLAGFAFLLLWVVTGFLLLLTKEAGAGRARARPPVVRSCPPVALAPILASTLRRNPARAVQGVMPGADGAPIMVMLLDRDALPWAKSTTLTFDGCTGAIQPVRPAPALMRFMIAAKSLHTGVWGREPALLLYLGAGLLPLLLVLTGLWLWLRRCLPN